MLQWKRKKTCQKTSLVVFLLCIHTCSWGIPGTGATEYTQILNHEILIETVKKLSSLILEEQKIKKQLIDQYRLSKLALKKMQSSYLEKLIEEEPTVVHFIHEAKEFDDYVLQYKKMLDKKKKEISQLHMSAEHYFKEEKNLLEQLGGLYKKRVDHDLKTAQQLDEKIASLKKASLQIEKIDGTTQGIQLLAAQLTLLKKEVEHIETFFIQAIWQNDTEKQLQHYKNTYENEIRQKSLEIQKTREKRDKTLRQQIITPGWHTQYDENSREDS